MAIPSILRAKSPAFLANILTPQEGLRGPDHSVSGPHAALSPSSKFLYHLTRLGSYHIELSRIQAAFPDFSWGLGGEPLGWDLRIQSLGDHPNFCG